MRIEYSPAVLLALNKAALISQQAGLAQVGPIDLLRGLMDEEEGHPVLLMRAAGVSMDNLRGLLPFCDIPGEVAEDLPLAAATAQVLSHAWELARLHGAEGSVTSDFLLLAILEVDLPTRSLLEGIGLDFNALKDRITPPAQPLRLEAPLDLGPANESIDTARIVDASANRAREALRVLEDFARFVRGDAFLSGRLKNLRHQFAESLEHLPAHLLLQSRDTLHDVGTTITTPQEQERASPDDVARANAKRLQEALRSLEEFGKILNSDFGQTIEQLRYESYTLERALLGVAARSVQLAQAKLYVLVTEAACRASLVGTVREALAGGAQIIQLREKARDDRVLLEMARDLRKMTRTAGALFIVNDRPDIALLAEADGVHLGQDDLPVQQARRLLGPDALIGVSTHDLDQVRSSVLEGANYLGVGPTFPSKTKKFERFPGLEFVGQVAAETALPAFALGGVTAANVHEVLAAGGTRVAVSHAVCAAEDPRAAARRIRDLLDER
ncbi:MAG TPA: thiamine phosphate synthase [Gemmataceae bacterium]|jgi:thiamine-phosphate pyrophosphorylase|nr:thiamine phosphate synthase [Gemmataceae bacterium]